ncbi:MAG: hypothetical protein HeimC3_40930 [Candidatus Heimdallarchaeota archaeon LC_3]|nr:MAG: hypothetical protein HeimC3_40930 [Candidatus Heimdallarchaeota archaeon LC_3]
MKRKTTSIRINDLTKDKIYSLVRKGYFRSFGDFIRSATNKLLEEYEEMLR